MTAPNVRPTLLPILLIGGGRAAGVYVDLLARLGRPVAALVDPAARPRKFGIPVIEEDDQVFARFGPQAVWLVNAVQSVGPRRAIHERYSSRGYRFDTLVDPTAVSAADVVIEDGAQVLLGAAIQAGVRLGRNCLVNTRATIDHDCIIGAHSHVAPGAVLAGGTVVGEGVHVGAGATVVREARIGAGATVGAGAVVIGDVPAAATVVGVPARLRVPTSKCPTGGDENRSASPGSPSSKVRQ